MANKPNGNGLFFSKPWSDRPRWSRQKDIISVALIGGVLLLVIWEAVRRWLGH